MARRKKYTPKFKAKVVIELFEGDDSLSAVAGRHRISPGLLSDWRRQLTDNVYIERRFRDLKHCCIYQREYSTFGELRRLVAEYVDNHNDRKLHGSLGYETPASWCYSGLNSRDRAALPSNSVAK